MMRLKKKKSNKNHRRESELTACRWHGTLSGRYTQNETRATVARTGWVRAVVGSSVRRVVGTVHSVTEIVRTRFGYAVSANAREKAKPVLLSTHQWTVTSAARGSAGGNCS